MTPVLQKKLKGQRGNSCVSASQITVLRMTPISSISHSTTSPFLRKTGGFRNTPTPEGVPVRKTSPGHSVTNCETQATSCSVLKII
uniref:Uncharacterized protein n=1 Tax=Anguilla anguilla TaxID=7936 RepID=A0A0E9PCL0_ANGAN